MTTRLIHMITRQWLAAAVVLMLLLWVGIARATTSLDLKLLRAANKGSLEQVSTLLAKGGKLNAKGDFGETILLAAGKSGNLDLVKFLIGKGLDVNVKDETGSTVLMYVTKAPPYYETDLEVAELLKAHGAKE
jgi:ankyrin repeat protein